MSILELELKLNKFVRVEYLCPKCGYTRQRNERTCPKCGGSISTRIIIGRSKANE